jgi:hypothetical protein
VAERVLPTEAEACAELGAQPNARRTREELAILQHRAAAQLAYRAYSENCVHDAAEAEAARLRGLYHRNKVDTLVRGSSKRWQRGKARWRQQPGAENILAADVQSRAAQRASTTHASALSLACDGGAATRQSRATNNAAVLHGKYYASSRSVRLLLSDKA